MQAPSVVPLEGEENYSTIAAVVSVDAHALVDSVCAVVVISSTVATNSVYPFDR